MIKFRAHGDFRGGSILGDRLEFFVRDSTQHWFQGQERIEIRSSEFIKHLKKIFGDLGDLKIDITLHK